ncbi:MAG: hypothetical protein MAG451_01053 [Anaerolineales bacterium]|nr:hypothetical protein [Anaerolineales bacterium]
MSELGQVLREARESKGISLVEAEEATRIRHTYIQALEEDNYEVLPPGVYVRGILRNYATFLDLDPEQTLAAYQDGSRSSREPAEPRIISEPLAPDPLINWEIIAGVVMLVALLAVLALVYRQYIAPIAGQPAGTPPVATGVSDAASSGTPAIAAVVDQDTPTVTPTLTATPTPTPQPPTPTVTQTPPATATPAPASVSEHQLTLTLTVTARSWTRVVRDGEEAYVGILEPGEERTWEAQSQIDLRTGNAGGLIAALNGEEVGPLGQSGQVLDYFWRLSATGEVVTVTPTP